MVTLLGSLVVASIASVNDWPPAVATSTIDWPPSVRGFDSFAIGSSAARTAVTGWCSSSARRSAATGSGARVAVPFGATL